MLQPEGIVNRMLKNAGLISTSLPFFSNATWARVTVIVIDLWVGIPYTLMQVTGILKNIPADLYEAAKVDGANSIQMFFKITLPMLTPTVLFNVIMQTIGAFQEFTSAFIITAGGPMKSTYMYGMMLYNNSFKYYKMGYASAQSWILFIIIMAVTGLLFLSSRKWVYYEDGGN